MALNFDYQLLVSHLDKLEYIISMCESPFVSFCFLWVNLNLREDIANLRKVNSILKKVTRDFVCNRHFCLLHPSIVG